MLALSIAVLLGGKYLVKKTFFNSSQVVIEFEGRDWSQARALSLKEKGNRRNRIASGFTPFAFTVSAYCTNTNRCKFGSSVGLQKTGSAERQKEAKVSARNRFER